LPRPGFITGLESEAGCLVTFFDRATVRISGARPDTAERAARALVDAGCDLLVSFGLAGALIAGVAPGTVVVATAVIGTEGESYAPDPALSAAIRGRSAPARALPIAGSDAIVGSVRDKIRLNQGTGAAAVDMESHRVARVARAHGMPFIAIRVVADSLDSAIPRAAFDAIDEDGRSRPRAVLAALVRRPWEIVALARLAAQSRAAHRSLRHVAPVLGDLLLG
jgi:hopanoid-associated phosphorylase